MLQASKARPKLDALQKTIEGVIRGKHEVVRHAITGLLAEGHILFEDLPGVGKTTLAHSLASAIDLSFTRIQFTSDMLPSDILGVTIYDPEKHEFEFRPGPIFAHIVVVDEINRTTPKTQSALLQAMNTAEVSMDKQTYPLPDPFMVIATQNPVDSYGTFPLPQSQLDRFLLRLHMGYPDRAHERAILQDNRSSNDFSMIRPVLTGDELKAMQAAVREVRMEDSLASYIVDLAAATRKNPRTEVGISTRAAIALQRAAKARAYLEGRDFCTPDDIKTMAVPTLAHRIKVADTFETVDDGIGRGSSLIEEILGQVRVPV
jgi:MoxR-like ATPase